ncbi:sel1 repeat family protein [Sulfurospirillum barnesii]|uniref:TonB C-terminal domain-containing protein n=1 Tax=Sulfurospirillum barnesii (strain ATCC 700032 / DSM 10660 / SES-3) TaxID=760154 RepID=I3XWQ6_SULBS|nr:sel1 repeat family protein [Sulfurospirillum barnesii]AFL68380.1 hypothetical protein Sulba_1083 [Sulfurospirillum barnesii SES-3]
MKQITCIFFVISFVLLFIGCGKGPTIDPEQIAYNTSMRIKKTSIEFSGDDDTHINVLEQKCKELHELDACYMAGLYYEKQVKTNSAMLDKAFYYYNLGCFHFYDGGFLKKKLEYKTDGYCCLGQARIFKKKENISTFYQPLAAMQLKRAADYYYSQEDFEQALEYYLATIQKAKLYDANIYYILSQMALKGEGQEVDYKLSKEYYYKYLPKDALKLPNMELLKTLIFSRFENQSDNVHIEERITLNENGTIEEVILTKQSEDEIINQEFIKQSKEKIYHPIPSVYGIKTMIVPVNFVIKFNE